MMNRRTFPVIASWVPALGANRPNVPAPDGHPFNGLKDFPGEFDWGGPPAKESENGHMRGRVR